MKFLLISNFEKISEKLDHNAMFQARDYKWNDMSCDEPAHYICEMRCAVL